MKGSKISLLLMFLLMLTGCNKVIVDKLPKDYYIKTSDTNYEIYEEISLKDIIKETNITIDNIKIVPKKLGKNTYDWYFKINKKKYLYHINYNVVDTTEPKIYGGPNKTFYVGNEQNICDLVMYGDNYDRDPQCTVDGDYDFNKVGTYKVKISVTDSSSNRNNFNMTINVIDPPKKNDKDTNNTKAEPTKVLFSDVLDKYKTEDTEIGIDVSRWQGDVDYTKIKDAGAEFVLMRIGVQQDLNEEISMDSKFKQNIKNAKKADLKVGVYLYSMAMSKEESIKQAKWIIKQLKHEKIDLPIVFDWENWSKWNTYKLSFYDINEIADSFMKTVEDAGYTAMLYSSKFYLENIWENRNNYDVWLAHYTNNTLSDYNGKYKFWQLCSDGKIDGISGDVDIDVFYK